MNKINFRRFLKQFGNTNQYRYVQAVLQDHFIILPKIDFRKKVQGVLSSQSFVCVPFVHSRLRLIDTVAFIRNVKNLSAQSLVYEEYKWQI